MSPQKSFKLLAILLLIFLSACGGSQENQYQGYIEGENTYLASPYSGTLMQLGVQRGERVTKGQFLFQLDENPQIMLLKKGGQDIAQAKHMLNDLNEPLRPQEIAAIKAQIAQVEANISLAELRVKRYQHLYEKNASAKDTLDEAIENLTKQQKLKDQYVANLQLGEHGSRDEQIRAQEKKIESLTSEFEVAKWELAQKRMKAPNAGIIFDTYFTIGAFVGAGQAVLSLLSYDHVYAIFFVPKEDLARIKIGQEIMLSCDGCNKTEAAIVRYISPEAEYAPPLVYSRENHEKIVFRIKASVKDYQYFKPGLPVTVTVK